MTEKEKVRDPLVEATVQLLSEQQLDEASQRFGGSCQSCRTGYHLFVFEPDKLSGHPNDIHDERICSWCGEKTLKLGRG